MQDIAQADRDEGADLRTYWRILLRWWWVLVLGVVGAGVGGFLGSKAMTPVYEATAKVLVQRALTPGTPSLSDISASQELADSYGDLIKTRPILEQVVEKLSLPYGAGALYRKIEVSSPRSLIEITVADPDPQMAASIANTVANTFINDFLDKQFTQIAQFQYSLEGYGITQDPSIVAAQAATMSTLRMAEAAVPPSSPSSPRVRFNVLLAAMTGLLMAGLVVFVLEYLDDRIRSPEQLKNIAGGSVSGGLAALGSVIRQPVRRGLLPVILGDEQGRGIMAESYKYVTLNLEFASLTSGQVKTILVTSALPGEGKTTNATNLALSLARGGKIVVLVDGDLRKPGLHRVFGLDSAKGLTNALLGSASVDDVLLPTAVENLKVVSSGPLPPDPTLVLRSNRMGEIIGALADRADVVVFDSPPVLAVADPLVMASQVDGVVLIVDAGRTRREPLRRATQSLQQAKTPILGAILNKVTARRRGGYYYYYYYSEDGTRARRRHSKRRRRFRALSRLFRKPEKGRRGAGAAEPSVRAGHEPGVEL